ncbi:Biopterin transport-related protein BT1 [Corchorus olitorius]|uniref:Coatomer subunit zeta n=1 Tax=Corchorus olitorius TaxID=93759 RepID=A0A1R3GR77_9ROSI|nr:Biopterin transport-related protein BT1 [Corchorus olitorius]
MGRELEIPPTPGALWSSTLVICYREVLENLDLIFLCIDEIVDQGMILETDSNVLTGQVAIQNMLVSAPLSERTISKALASELDNDMKIPIFVHCHLALPHVELATNCIWCIRNSKNSSAMRGQSNGGGVRGFASPDRGAHDKRHFYSISDAINQLKFMPFLILSGQLCPPGTEGSLFALSMSINNFGSTNHRGGDVPFYRGNVRVGRLITGLKTRIVETTFTYTKGKRDAHVPASVEALSPRLSSHRHRCCT